MFPELIRVGSIALPTYGVLLAIGFLLALMLLRRRAPSFGIDPDVASDTGIWILLAGLFGAKALLAIIEWPRYVASWAGVVDLIRSAGVFYGGLIGGLIATFILFKRRHLDFWAMADAIAPAVALGQAIGRLGCFTAGCCWGKSTHMPWGVIFRSQVAEHNVGVPLGVPLHPTQLYEAFAVGLLFVFLLRFEKRRFPGETFARYLIGYAVLRFVIELFRGDPRGSVLGGLLSTSQLIALCCALAGVAVYLLRRRAAPAPAVA